jgi:hypothetical protein
MKLRITDNTLRVRLSESDLLKLSAGEGLEISLAIGIKPLVFRLSPATSSVKYTSKESTTESSTETTLNSNISVVFSDHEVCIAIEKMVLEQWISSKENQLAFDIAHPNNQTLSVMVEKDYLG